MWTRLASCLSPDCFFLALADLNQTHLNSAECCECSAGPCAIYSNNIGFGARGYHPFIFC